MEYIFSTPKNFCFERRGKIAPDATALQGLVEDVII